ncbi:hypothetical protein JM47_01950 [Ureaplasma diversum]|uniref:Uncharacterized protein n=1 Tax=Ureaplasma diversum TaxID=42094 RepID=A0A0C5RL27_9BACT|nr:hypothetical protein [Ureaplasma diversum]AJQ45353.1 hypothetical protein JM47_01950 [Ureaplasma diversum]
MDNNKKQPTFQNTFERTKVDQTAVFDINDINDAKPLEEYTLEELRYTLEYESLDKKKRDTIKRLIKEIENA